MTINTKKNSTDGTECIECICVRGCNSGDGSYAKKFSSTWFSHRTADWLSLLTLCRTRCRMFPLCDSESASQLFLPLSPSSSSSSSCAPISTSPPHQSPLPQPNQLFLSLFFLNGTMEGLNPGYFRRVDPSLIALSPDTVSRLHDSADTLTWAHLPAS